MWRPDAQRAHERLLADAAAVAVAGWDGRFGGLPGTGPLRELFEPEPSGPSLLRAPR